MRRNNQSRVLYNLITVSVCRVRESVLLNGQKFLSFGDVQPSGDVCDCKPGKLPQVTRGVQKSERKFELHFFMKSDYVPCLTNIFEYFVAHNVAGRRDEDFHSLWPKYRGRLLDVYFDCKRPFLSICRIGCDYCERIFYQSHDVLIARRNFETNFACEGRPSIEIRMGKTGQQVLVLFGIDGDGHVLDPALKLVGCVVLYKSVKAVMPDSELNVLRHICEYPGQSHICVLIIRSWVVNSKAHFMNALHPGINCGQHDDSLCIVCLRVLGVFDHWVRVSSVGNSHVLVAIRRPCRRACRSKVGRDWWNNFCCDINNNTWASDLLNRQTISNKIKAGVALR